MLLGRGIMINWNNVAPDHRPAYDAWHCGEHMVGRLKIPGFLRGRRYIAASYEPPRSGGDSTLPSPPGRRAGESEARGPKAGSDATLSVAIRDERAVASLPEQARRNFLTMYEVEDLAVLTSADYLAKANSPSPLTLRTTPLVRDSVRGLASVRASHGAGTGGYALTLRFDPQPGGDDTLEHYLAQQALPQIAQRADIVGAHLIVADKAASAMTPVERQGRPTTIPNWIVLIEGFTLDAVNNAGEAGLSDASLVANGCAASIERDTYALQFMLASRRDIT